MLIYYLLIILTILKKCQRRDCGLHTTFYHAPDDTLPQVFFPIIEPLFLNLMNDFSNLDCMTDLSLFKDFLKGVVI